MAANSVIGDGIWQKLKLIQAFIVDLVTCKNNENVSKNESTRLLTTLLLLLVYGDFFISSRADYSVNRGQILPNFKPIEAFITVLVTCKNE